MARHAVHTSPRRALLRAGLTVTAAGAALGLAGAAAQAAQAAEPAAPASASDIDTPLAGAGTAAANGLVGAVAHTVSGGVSPITKLQLDPLANTGTDPLDNAVGTQVADFKPLTTAVVTGPVTDGAALADLPVIGGATQLITG
jgi:hypothetical protein